MALKKSLSRHVTVVFCLVLWFHVISSGHDDYNEMSKKSPGVTIIVSASTLKKPLFWSHESFASCGFNFATFQSSVQ